MIELVDKLDCTGCSSCSNICPTNSIQMKSDKEGFVYPEIEHETCLQCGKCNKACPINNPVEMKTLESYIVQNIKSNERKISTAGGAFYTIANEIINSGGVVFGVRFDEDFTAIHDCVSDHKGLMELVGSKYVQSNIGTSFKRVKKFLLEDKWVLFSGTPCQVAGLYCYLGADYKKLITVAVVCRAVPSPYIFSKYIEYQTSKYKSKIDKIRCRDKYYGYNYSTMSLYFKNGKEYHRSIESDPWLRIYFSGVANRPSCKHCKYKEPIGDFLIGDYFKVGDYSSHMNDNKGTTRMQIQTEKGKCVFNSIKNKYIYANIGTELLRKTVHNQLYTTSQNSIRRLEFFEDAHNLNGRDLIDKYFPYSFKVFILHYGRYITFKLGIYDYLKKVLLRRKGS